jgi:hypothetical protein
MIMGSFGRYVVETAHDHDVGSLARLCGRRGLADRRVPWDNPRPYPQAAKSALRNTLYNVIPVSA